MVKNLDSSIFLEPHGFPGKNQFKIWTVCDIQLEIQDQVSLCLTDHVSCDSGLIVTKQLGQEEDDSYSIPKEKTEAM